MNATRSEFRSRVPALLLGGFLALLLLVAATGGPDCLRYLDWSRAVQTGEIVEIPGELRGPAGVPLTQWSHGPGLFFALPYLSPSRHLVTDGPFAPIRDFRFMGWLSALALWGGLLGVLRRIARDDWAITLFVAAAAFAGTHLGFYSYVHSSEILSFGCMALITYRLCVSSRLGRFDVLGVGTLCGSLVLIRPHLAVYLPLLLGVLTWRLRRQDPISSARRRAVDVVSIVTPVLLALLQVLWVNRWMTGSFLRSTHVFGDGTFRSLDLARPEILAVLMHPWHGLLVYHPLYALAFVLVLLGIFRGSLSSRRLHLGVALTLIVHLYIQAAWYCWWLGLWSLGNRGFGVGAVLLVPVLAHAMREGRPRGRLALAAGVLVCSLWSVVLMAQGHTNFMRWSELLAAQAAAVLGIAPVLPVVLAAACVAYWLARGRDRNGRLLAAGTTLLVALVLDHLALRVIEVVAGSMAVRFTALRLCLVSLAPVTVLLDSRPAGPRHATDGSGLRIALAAISLALFLWTGALFLRLALRTEQVIEAGGVPGAGPVAGYMHPEVEESYREYLRVPEFEDKKRALRAFLERSDP